MLIYGKLLYRRYALNVQYTVLLTWGLEQCILAKEILQLYFAFYKENVISILQVVDFRKKTITYYDSMGGSNNEACRILL